MLKLKLEMEATKTFYQNSGRIVDQDVGRMFGQDLGLFLAKTLVKCLVKILVNCLVKIWGNVLANCLSIAEALADICCDSALA